MWPTVTLQRKRKSVKVFATFALQSIAAPGFVMLLSLTIFNIYSWKNFTFYKLSSGHICFGMRYHLSWLTNKFDKGESLNYIFFWGHTNKESKPVGEFILSQWYHSPFSVNEITYKSAAHWMMARKAFLFGDRDSFSKIINADRPDEVRAYSRNIKGFDEAKWSEWKYEIVKEGNFHKFRQNKKLRAYLLSTKDSILVEANPVDEVWGIGLAQDSKYSKDPYSWNGLNLLGFALMEVRDYLRHFEDFGVQPKSEVVQHIA